MENQDLLSELQEGRNDIIMNPQMKNTLFSLAKWVKFIAITSISIMGLFLLVFIFGGSTVMAALSENSMLGSEMGFGIGMMMFYSIIFAFGIYIMFLLYDFATKMQKGLKSNNEVLIEQGFRSMRRHYKIYGIFIAIYLVVLAVSFIIVLLGGLSTLM